MDEAKASIAGNIFVSSMENGLDLIRKERPFRKFLSYDFLNNRGLDEVDIIISAVLATNDDAIDCMQMLTQIAGLLLLYMAPAETYCIL